MEFCSGSRAACRRKKKGRGEKTEFANKKKKNIAIYVATAGYVCQGLYEGRKRQEHHVDLWRMGSTNPPAGMRPRQHRAIVRSTRLLRRVHPTLYREPRIFVDDHRTPSIHTYIPYTFYSPKFIDNRIATKRSSRVSTSFPYESRLLPRVRQC